MVVFPNTVHDPSVQTNFDFLSSILSQISLGDLVIAGAPGAAPNAKIALTDSRGVFLGYVAVSPS